MDVPHEAAATKIREKGNVENDKFMMSKRESSELDKRRRRRKRRSRKGGGVEQRPH